MPLVLIESLNIIGKTMICMHTSEQMIRNGMNLSDSISRNIRKAFSNIFCLNYIRRFVTSPEKYFLTKNHYAAYYEHIKYGLLEKKLKRMVLINSRQISIIVNYLQEMKEMLVNELLLINLSRGTEVQEILYDKNGTDMQRIFEKLWPELEIIIMMNQGYYKIHTHRIRKYIGNIKIYCPVYSIPEITIGYDTMNESLYTIDPRKAYFEFLPINGIKIKSIRNLKISEYYNVVISSKSSDLIRYQTGEIIKVMGYFNGAPKIEIIGKESDLIKIKDLMITPDVIENLLAKEFLLVDYCYRHANSNESNKVKIYIEIDDSGYLKKLDKVIDVIPKIKDIGILDYLLDKVGIDAEVRIVMPGTFELLYKNRYMDEIDPASVQIPRYIKDSFDMDILREKIVYMF
jgi:hypothetical protein